MLYTYNPRILEAKAGEHKFKTSYVYILRPVEDKEHGRVRDEKGEDEFMEEGEDENKTVFKNFLKCKLFQRTFHFLPTIYTQHYSLLLTHMYF